MAIFRPKQNAADPDLTVADFSFQSDSLAQMIVDAWLDNNFKNQLLTKAADGTSPNAKSALAARGIYLDDPVVITETDYNNGYYKHDDDEVVFVLPNASRVVSTGSVPPGQSLLETARFLMACVPNGI